jgi:hypothetical protein
MINDPTVGGIGCTSVLWLRIEIRYSTVLMRAVSAVCDDFMGDKINARHSDDDRKIARELRSQSYSFQNLVQFQIKSNSGFL